MDEKENLLAYLVGKDERPEEARCRQAREKITSVFRAAIVHMRL